MIQGAADGVTWVAGLPLVADLYGPDDRGRVMGYVMSGTSVGIIVGPSVGGWLYQAGGVALPFVFASALSLVCGVGFLFIQPPAASVERRHWSMWSVVRAPGVTPCVVAVVVIAPRSRWWSGSGLVFDGALGLGPAQIGLLFGGGRGGRGDAVCLWSDDRSLGRPPATLAKSADARCGCR
jgi:MFS family permease